MYKPTVSKYLPENWVKYCTAHEQHELIATFLYSGDIDDELGQRASKVFLT